MELVTIVSLTALVASGFALLVAVGSALHVQNLQGTGTSGEVGLAPGARVDEVLAPFVDPSGVDAWLQGPTLIVVAKGTCPSCHDLIANMNRRAADLASFRVLMIERGQSDGPSLKEAASFDALWVQDPNSRSKDLLRTNVSPHAFVVEDGKVVRQHSGALAVTFLLGESSHELQKPALATTA